ncbi:hydroxyacid dehydrogenase [Krasilnikoviella flava]|uniref:Phosphoglycerate dehydrogenase n=1 Tax=Krasilnikoviella flava TaxID=526729 RepID=A0A1T5LYQ7_9MICO|nr:hydroxyacid dehydrogenase [Krasilnikoviella flava]SKC80729.1 Phosphoglycerate dehydrogenase [Krasilnikoviella flava]
MPHPTAPTTILTAVGDPWARSVLDPAVRDRLAAHGVVTDLATADDDALASARVLVTGWGAPTLDAALLDRLPRMELVAHAAGSVQGLVTPGVWARGIRVTSAAHANARAVADFTVSMVHLAVKNVLRLGLTAARTHTVPGRDGIRGLDGSVVGLVGFGLIARLVAETLRPLDVRVLAHDPYYDAAEARRAGVELVGLADVLTASDVVSVHAPLTDGTRGMLGAAELGRLAPSATLVNTARGGLLDHDALARTLAARDDLFAVLDVTDPEPLPAGHPLLALDNVFLTPHVAGSLGTEEARLGRAAAEEVDRWAAGEPLRHETRPEQLPFTA